MDGTSTMQDVYGDDQLIEVWKRVVREFETVTGERLAEPTTLDMQKQLVQISESNKHELFKKSAESIYKVAQYATSAASSVFPQASMVFDALSAVGDTIQGYRSNFTPKRVLEQLRKVNEELNRIEVYMTPNLNGIELDKALQTSIIQQLTQILYLCTIYAKVKKDFKSVPGTTKNILKAAIGWDGGIGSRLQEIKDIKTRELSDNVAALRVSDLTTNHKNLRDSNSKRLREYLNLGSREYSWIDRKDILERAHIAGMGEWMYEQQELQAWLDVDHHTETPVLLLNAEVGRGKSHLCSQTIRLLNHPRKNQYRTGSAAVAWVFFQGVQQGLKPSDGKGKNFPLAEALKAFIWQLAESDAPFQSFAVRELRKHPQGLTDAMDFWSKIIMGFFKSPRSESATPQKIFFLILDGYDDTETASTSNKDKMQAIMEDVANLRKQGSQIRILLSGRAAPTHKNLFKIELSLENQKRDAEVLIRSHLEKSHELWDKEGEEYRILWGIRNDLVVAFDGNYHNLKASLQEIKRLGERGLSYLREIQGGGLKDSGKSIQRKLEMLSADLDWNDFEVLNQLMACVVHWKAWPTIQQANDYLFLRLGNRDKPPVETQIAQKFGRLLFIEDNTIRISSEHLSFLDNTKDTIIYPRDEDGIRLPIQHQSQLENMAISKIVVDASHAQRPSADVSSQTSRKLAEGNTFSRPRIQFDPIGGRVDMIIFLLQIACDEEYKDRAESRRVGEYTAIWLPQHFAEVTAEKLQEVPETKRRKVGKYLGKFFKDEQIVESWMPRGDIEEYLSSGWQNDIDHVLEWLNKDSYVRKGFIQQLRDQKDKMEREAQESRPGTSNDNTDSGSGSGCGEQPATEGEQKYKTERETQESRPETSNNSTDTGSGSGFRPASRDQRSTNKWAEVATAPGEAFWPAILYRAYGYLMTRPSSALPTPPQAAPPQAVPQATLPQDPPPLTPNDLLDICIKVLASQWLQQYRWDAFKALQFLLEVSNKATGSVVASYPQPASFYEGRLSFPIVEGAEKLAMNHLDISVAQSRRNPTHDVRVAETLINLSTHEGYSRAEEKCELVQMLDPLNVKAALNLSHVLEKRNRMKPALDELLKIRTNIQSSAFRKSNRDAWRNELERFWSLCSCTGSAKEAFNACIYLADEFPDELFPFEKAFNWIMKDDKLDDNLEILSTKRQKDGRSILTMLFCSHASSDEFHRRFNSASRELHRLLSHTYEDAISSAASQTDVAFLHYYYGIAQFRQGSAPQALNHWKLSVDVLRKEQEIADDPQSMFRTISLVAERLGSAYLGLVLEKKLTEADKVYISHLEEYLKWMDEKYPYEVNYLTLLLGRIHQVNGDVSKAVSSVRKHLDKALSLLQNDRDEDDWKGFLMLAEALTILEDDENARAAWSILVNAPDTERAEELSIPCAGQCEWTWTGSTTLEKDLYICRECPRVKFERDCYDDLKKNSIKHDTCWKGHSFLIVPRRKQAEVRVIEFKKVLVGKTKTKYESWLDSLGQRYGIHQPNLPWHRRTTEFVHITKWRCQRAVKAATKGTIGKAKR